MKDWILFEDKHLLVVKKPAGIAVQTAKLAEQDLESMCRNYLAEQTKKAPYLGLVHRLDQPVQGIIVFAKSEFASRELSAQLAKGNMNKTYLAVVRMQNGKSVAKSGRLTDYLVKDGKTNCSQIVPASAKGAKKAEMEYRIKKYKTGYALVEVHLLTGRHHQIRVQLAGAGMPIYGDGKYGGAPKEEREMALCAAELEFMYPGTKKKMKFTCEPEGTGFTLV